MAGFPDLTYTGVLIHRRDHVYLSSVSDELEEQGVDHAAILRWLDGRWAHKSVSVAVRGLAIGDSSRPTLVNMGVDGTIVEFLFPGDRTEVVDPSDTVPSRLLQLRCMRTIRGRAWVAGVGRRVYRREAPGRWIAVDDGVFVPRAQRESAVGFHAIDGHDEASVVAVGQAGEIWRFDGRAWHREDSPAEVALHCVRCLPDGSRRARRAQPDPRAFETVPPTAGLFFVRQAGPR